MNQVILLKKNHNDNDTKILRLSNNGNNINRGISNNNNHNLSNIINDTFIETNNDKILQL